jgi:hypothetical protein
MPYGTIKVDTITFTAGGVDTSVSVSGLAQAPTITGNLTVTGTVTANTVTGAAGNFTNIQGVTIQGTTSISGLAITGGTAGFTTVTGTTVTGTTANFVTVSGTTVTGTTSSFSGNSSAAAFIPIATGIPTNGMYLVTGNVIGFAASGIKQLEINSAGLIAATGQISGGSITGATAGFGTVTGTTVTGTTANFVTVSGTTVTGTTINATSGVFTTQISGRLYKASGDVTVISGSGDVRPYGLYSFPTTTGVSGYVLTTNSDGSSTWQSKQRSVSASATSGTLTPNVNTTDIFVASGLAGAITMAVPTGTRENGQRLLLRFKDNGTGRAITWTTSTSGYRAIGITLPTTTVANKTTYVGCIYNSADTYWDALAAVTEA